MSRILLIDDDVQVNEVMKATLEVLGHSVMAVDDPQKISEVFESFRPDVTLVDYMLPGCSGLDVLRKLSGTHIPSVFYLATGMADFNLLKRAVEAGATSLLSKPYRISDLVLTWNSPDFWAALRDEKQPDQISGSLLCTCPVEQGVASAELGELMAFARSRGANEDLATRRLPIVAGALMKNALIHGSPAGASSYQVELKDLGISLQLIVSDEGPGFDWQKAMARARSCMEKPCASGLQLVIALSDEISYENGGRTAYATLSKLKRVSP